MNSLSPPIFLLAAALFALPVGAAVFGDDNSQNGVEDQRLSQQEAKDWPSAFKAVGRIYCVDEDSGRASAQGNAILFKQSGPEGEWTPAVLTARHIFDGFDIESCTFAPEWDSWKRVHIRSTLFYAGAYESSRLPEKYVQDWSVFQLSPWPGWARFALELKKVDLVGGRYSGHMVSLDMSSDQMVVHSECSFGASQQSRLLTGYEQLFWDDCDSTRGASGGALFIRQQSQYQLVGFRVGSFFDEVVVGKRPAMGSRFDIHANLNVSRAIPVEIFEMGCSFSKESCASADNP